MSKLKTRRFFEAVPTSKAGFYQPGAFVDGYLKSEADKVIAELNEQFFELQETAIKIDKKLTKTRKELRHEKYKRCLAMAWWCSAELGELVSTWEFKIKHYKKWQKRWLELAKQFKEAK